MKKIITFIFVFSILFTLYGCNENQNIAGSVKIVSGGNEYIPFENWIFSQRANGTVSDGARKKPDEVSDELILIPWSDDFEIVISGKTTGNQGYTIFNEQFEKVYSQPKFELPSESGEYIVSMEVVWGSEKQFDGYQYLFKLAVLDASSSEADEKDAGIDASIFMNSNAEYALDIADSTYGSMLSLPKDRAVEFLEDIDFTQFVRADMKKEMPFPQSFEPAFGQGGLAGNYVSFGQTGQVSRQSAILYICEGYSQAALRTDTVTYYDIPENMYDTIKALMGKYYSASSHVQDNVVTEQLTPATDTEKLPANSEQALEDFLTYLRQSLTDDQHGGVHRVSDFNGSGLYIHGGPDKADTYVVIWVIDKNTVDRVVESYTGQKVDIVRLDAVYSMSRLNSIMSELQNSEIAPYINGIALRADNKVLIDVIGKDNQDKVNGFLQSYKYKDALSLFIRPENGEH